MTELPVWLQQTLQVLVVIAPYVIWSAVCLWAINWSKMWPTLREGAWVPLVLLMVLAALVWSQVNPTTFSVFGILTVGNFWWQLTAVGLFAALGLFCGWVQERYHWTPMEVSVEPPAHGDGHGEHGHGHH